jgi:hypothetical protein
LGIPLQNKEIINRKERKERRGKEKDEANEEISSARGTFYSEL